VLVAVSAVAVPRFLLSIPATFFAMSLALA